MWEIRQWRNAALVLALWMGLASTTAVAQYQGWLIPEGGRDAKSPLTSSRDVVMKGSPRELMGRDHDQLAECALTVSLSPLRSLRHDTEPIPNGTDHSGH
jgi:hypothetical protein